MNHQPITALNRARFEGLICAALLAGLLAVGLWPFHSPRNRVNWLEPGKGLGFRGHSIIWTAAELAATGPAPPGSSSLEIWLQPGRGDDSGTIFASYTTSGRFLLRQYYSGVLLESTNRNGRAALYVDGVMSKGHSSFITITLSPQGTSVYVNGTMLKTSRRFRLSSADLRGRLVLGTSPFADDCWVGSLRGLALHDREFTTMEVLQRYRKWSGGDRSGVLLDASTTALYFFDESSGNAVRDHARSHSDLAIPPRFARPQPIFLEPIWEAFHSKWSFYQDVLINISGFIPFGFVVCAYLSVVRHSRRAVVLTILVGAMVSLTIEVLQIYLPTRSPQTIDVVTNTLGTFLGVLFFRRTSLGAIYNGSVEHMVNVLNTVWARRGIATALGGRLEQA